MNVPATITVRLSDGPLGDPPAADAGAADAGRTGARIIFEGRVRVDEDGRRLRALQYEAYEPMASRTLHALATETARAHGLNTVDVAHSKGEVPVGSVSFRLVIHAPHRKEALRAMDEFIDRMKKDVPIWKTPLWA